MVTKQTADKVSHRLRTHYQSMTSEQTFALWDEFREQVTDEEYIEAISRHIHDPERGTFPPRPADIERHLQAFHIERIRKREDEEGRKRREESDTTYVRAMNSPSWKAELKRGKEIREAIGRRFGFTFKTPGENRLLQQTLFNVQGDRGLGTVDEALTVAERILGDADGDLEKIPVKEMRYRQAENPVAAAEAAA